MLLLTIIITLAAAIKLLALVSEGFANGCARAAEILSGFFEYKAALRSARSVGLQHSARRGQASLSL